jgi:asparagine synthase (glutamine-hydrolysing)
MLCFISPESQLNSPADLPVLLQGSLFYQKPQKQIQDSFVTQREDQIIIFEGIVANSQDLLNRYACADIPALIGQALLKPALLAEMHGQFRLISYNRKSREINAFNNISNNCRLYYYHDGERFVLGDSIRVIMRVLLHNGIKASINPVGARMLLSYGYMLEGFSTIDKIQSLPAAGHLRYRAKQLRVERYHHFNSKILYRNTEEATRQLDQLFCHAVKNAFAKDTPGRHLAFLSGGLDSRMTVMCAHDKGIQEFNVLTFSEPGYLEAKIAEEIARDLKLNYHFYSLENGDYLKGLAQNTVYNDGQIILHGASHLFGALKDMNLNGIGIIHSGQIGAIMQGNFLSEPRHSHPDISAAAYSTRILASILPQIKELEQNYATQELLLLHNRGFNAAINGDLACAEYAYSLSPFLDPAFLQYGLNTDPALRYRTGLFLNWMSTCHPQAANYRWEKTGARPSDPRWLAKLTHYCWRGSNKIKLKLLGKANRLSMNPFDYWWSSNPGLQAILKQEFGVIEEVSCLLDKELKQDLYIMKNSPSLSEKLQAYSLAKGLQYLYNP